MSLFLARRTHLQPVGSSPLATATAAWEADSLGLSDGAAVSSWLDNNGGHQLAQANGTFQPVYVAAGPNGKPCVHFDSGAKVLASAAAISTTIQHVAVVFKNAATTFSARTYVTTYGTSGGFAVHTGYGTGSNQWMNDLGSGTSHCYLNGVAAPGDGTGGNWTDSGLSAWHVVEVTYARSDTGQTFCVGKPAQSYTCDWEIAAVVLYDHVPTTAERDTLLSYLGTKYGITVTLP